VNGLNKKDCRYDDDEEWLENNNNTSIEMKDAS
jgi:hypothetical protein